MKILFLLRHADPTQLQETIDAALVAGVFDQEVSLLFRDAGVEHLITRPKKEDDTIRNLLASLSDYDIKSLFVCNESLSARGFADSDLVIPATRVSNDEQATLIAQHQAVVND